MQDMSTDDEKDDSLAEMMSELDSVDENAADAEANKTSISDNNGGRIDLGEDTRDSKIIKK